MLIEDIVRPFQLLPVLRTTQIPVVVTEVPSDPGSKTWGKAGTVASPGQIPSGQDGVGFKVLTCNEHFAEEKRTTEPVRIANPSDPTQFVDVDRVVSINFKKTNNDKVLSSRIQTHWSEIDPWAGSHFGPVSDSGDSCDQSYHLALPNAG